MRSIFMLKYGIFRIEQPLYYFYRYGDFDPVFCWAVPQPIFSNIVAEKPALNLSKGFIGRLHKFIYIICSQMLAVSRVRWI